MSIETVTSYWRWEADQFKTMRDEEYPQGLMHIEWRAIDYRDRHPNSNSWDNFRAWVKTEPAILYGKVDMTCQILADGNSVSVICQDEYFGFLDTQDLMHFILRYLNHEQTD